jgi:hypothetical protein
MIEAVERFFRRHIAEYGISGTCAIYACDGPDEELKKGQCFGVKFWSTELPDCFVGGMLMTLVSTLTKSREVPHPVAAAFLIDILEKIRDDEMYDPVRHIIRQDFRAP